MRNNFSVVLTFALSAMIGGVGGYVVVDEFVMPRPPEFAAWKARRDSSKAGDGGGNGAAEKGAAACCERRIGGAEKVAADGLPRKHRWIAAKSSIPTAGARDTNSRGWTDRMRSPSHGACII